MHRQFAGGQRGYRSTGGKGPEDLKTVCFELAARMLELGGKGDIGVCRELVRKSISDGNALDKLGQLALRQGALYVPWDERAMDEAPVRHQVKAPFEGYVTSMRSELVGKASMILGAGRETKDSPIDSTAGIILLRKTGDYVHKGEILAELHTSSTKSLKEAEEMLCDAYIISSDAAAARPLIQAYINGDTVTRY
jgi:pyrimidine-nucleoside phosphorylase